MTKKSFIRSAMLTVASVTLSLFQANLCLSQQGPFIHNLIDQIKQNISTNVAYKPISKEMTKVLTNLSQNPICPESGPDAQKRPVFVGLQGEIEDVLAKGIELGKIKQFAGIMLTPMPATPFCNAPASVIGSSLHPSYQNMDAIKYSVIKRTVTARNLKKVGTMFAAYAKDGLKKRSEPEQKIYKDELLKKDEKLYDCELNCSTIPDKLVGAMYIFTNDKNEKFVFFIKSSQAVNPSENTWTLCLGKFDEPNNSSYTQEILDFLKDKGHPEIITAFEKITKS